MQPARPTIVLVHGAWHDRRCWDRVTAQLDISHTPWVTLTLPSTDPGEDLPGFADDVAAVVDVLDGLDGDVTLCGHGYGGMVISEAGNHPTVRRLVYLAAYCPRPGQSVLDLNRGLKPPGRPSLVRRHRDGTIAVRPSVAGRAFYGDLDPEEAEAKASMLLPSTAAIHEARAINPAWTTKPSTYVFCRRDRVIGNRRARDMGNLVVRSQLAYGRSETHLATLETGHSPFYSAPGQVAQLAIHPTCLRAGRPY